MSGCCFVGDVQRLILIELNNNKEKMKKIQDFRCGQNDH